MPSIHLPSCTHPTSKLTTTSPYSRCRLMALSNPSHQQRIPATSCIPPLQRQWMQIPLMAGLRPSHLQIFQRTSSQLMLGTPPPHKWLRPSSSQLFQCQSSRLMAGMRLLPPKWLQPTAGNKTVIFCSTLLNCHVHSIGYASPTSSDIPQSTTQDTLCRTQHFRLLLRCRDPLCFAPRSCPKNILDWFLPPRGPNSNPTGPNDNPSDQASLYAFLSPRLHPMTASTGT